MDEDPKHSPDRLAEAVQNLPDDALVPVGWIREQMVVETKDNTPAVDMTVGQVATLFGRSASTVRAWCQSGELRAYKLFGKSWRIPPASVEEFQVKQRAATDPQPPGRAKKGPNTDLGAWRKQRAAKARGKAA